MRNMANLQGYTNQNDNLHGLINAKNSLRAFLNIGGTATSGAAYYLGDISEYTEQNPLNLNTIKPGQYSLSNEYGLYSFYIQAIYKGQKLVSRCIMVLDGAMYADTIVLNMYRAVSDELSDGSHICNLSYIDMDEQTGVLSFKDLMVLLYSDLLVIYTGYMYEFRNVTTNLDQTIDSLKTFSVLPESNVAPTEDNQFVNKKYVDDKPAFKGLPTGVPTSGTTVAFISAMQALNLDTGNVYLGEVTFNDLPFNGNAEIEAYIYPGNVIYCVLHSSNVSPYLWTCNSQSYRGWEPISQQTYYDSGTYNNPYIDSELKAGMYICSGDFWHAANVGGASISSFYISGVSSPIAIPMWFWLSKDVSKATAGEAIGKCMFYINESNNQIPYAVPGALYTVNLYYNEGLYLEAFSYGAWGYGGTKLITSLAQTIKGAKTFGDIVTCSQDATAYNHLTNKKYVDNHALDLLGLQEYSRTATYNIGDCVYHDSLIYKCTVTINPPENWNASHWTEITYISYLKEILNE